MHEISRRVPVGAGHGGALKLKGPAFDRVLVNGPRILLAEHGIGTDDDVERTESEGCLAGADPAGGVRACEASWLRPAGHAWLG